MNTTRAMGRGFGHRLRRLALCVLLAPFVALALIPHGVMPIRGAEGLVLVICTGDGPLEMVVDKATGETRPREPADPGNSCVWANASATVMLQAPVHLADVHLSWQPAIPAGASAILAVARATGLPPATGPPAVL